MLLGRFTKPVDSRRVAIIYNIEERVPTLAQFPQLSRPAEMVDLLVMNKRDHQESPPERHDLKIEQRPIAALALRRDNPRSHSEKQIRQIAASIETFGFTNPVCSL